MKEYVWSVKETRQHCFSYFEISKLPASIIKQYFMLTR